VYWPTALQETRQLHESPAIMANSTAFEYNTLAGSWNKDARLRIERALDQTAAMLLEVDVVENTYYYDMIVSSSSISQIKEAQSHLTESIMGATYRYSSNTSRSP